MRDEPAVSAFLFRPPFREGWPVRVRRGRLSSPDAPKGAVREEIVTLGDRMVPSVTARSVMAP